MATIYNSRTTEELVRGAGIQTSRDRVPNQIADKVVPVMEVNPKLLKYVKNVATATATDSSTQTIMTTSSINETYITGVILTVSKDASSNSISSRIITTVNGVNNSPLAYIRYEPTTAGQFNQIHSYNPPILVDKNATISVTNSSATASIDTTGVIYYYEVSPSNS